MSRGITLLIGRLPTISGELAGLAASARRVISMMTTRVCSTTTTAVPGRWRAGARHNANIAECALSTYYTLCLYLENCAR